MVFQKDETGILQTAANAAATLTAASVTAGLITDLNEVKSFFDEQRTDIFGVLDLARIRDNEMFKLEEANKPARPSGGRSTGSSSKPAAASGGGRFKAVPGNKFKGTRDEALALELTFGKFKGVTVATILAMPASEAVEYNHGTSDSPKPGKTYVEWLTGNEQNQYMAEAAVLALGDAA